MIVNNVLSKQSFFYFKEFASAQPGVVPAIWFRYDIMVIVPFYLNQMSFFFLLAYYSQIQ
jgi:hypothetical protein